MCSRVDIPKHNLEFMYYILTQNYTRYVDIDDGQAWIPGY